MENVWWVEFRWYFYYCKIGDDILIRREISLGWEPRRVIYRAELSRTALPNELIVQRVRFPFVALAIRARLSSVPVFELIVDGVDFRDFSIMRRFRTRFDAQSFIRGFSGWKIRWDSRLIKRWIEIRQTLILQRNSNAIRTIDLLLSSSSYWIISMFFTLVIQERLNRLIKNWREEESPSNPSRVRSF